MLGIALTPVLVLAAVAPAAAQTTTSATTSATATTTVDKRAPGPWGTRTAHAPGSLRALVSAKNGTLVSFTDGIRIRPAGSTRWLAPQTWPDAGGYNTELVSLSDGSVRLVWGAKRPDDHNNYWLKMATLAPGATAFSEPEYIAEVPEHNSLHALAAAPDGRLVLAWSDNGVMRTAEKAGPGAEWTAPADLNTQPPIGSRGITNLGLTIAKDGTALVVWKWLATEVIAALEKAPGASGWTEVKDFPVPAVALAQPKVFASPQGGFDVFYTEAGHVMHTRRSAGATTWSTPRTAATSGSTNGMAAPVYLPGGDLFVAGGGPGSSVPWYAVRSAATGAWLPYKQPFPATKAQSVGAVATSGGTVTVTWRAGYAEQKHAMAAVFKGGTWSPARPLSESIRVGPVQVASDALGRPVVQWDQHRLTDSYSLDGTYQVTTTGRALSKWRDYTDDGKADLFGWGSGGLKVYAGGATELTAQKRVTSWPAGTLVLPYGDLDGDGCNDVFVRSPKGEARIFTPVCGGLPDQKTSSVKVSSNWSGYNAVVSPGDVTGDGRPDLLTRSAATGKLYLYANNGKGGFKARTLVGSGFGGYKKLIAAGDLNGDGRMDLLGLDGAKKLWRFDGTGKGTFKPRALVFKDWGATYKDVVGGLDLSGDGRADMISLDKSGRAWLNRGDGKGGLGKRSQVGKPTNWSSIRIS
ncbi:hypothetical protein BIV24_03530 [Streptomyces colonosanans]|uniref:VCBS repeat-containing protein n=1 Tax=Streptomyces colonosanans TaxID=1428652 RepID=A0A1S2Q1W6_9ACTN|nr:hypothetical protein BIV24_03530 [Streptomyces colonosanans]